MIGDKGLGEGLVFGDVEPIHAVFMFDNEGLGEGLVNGDEAPIHPVLVGCYEGFGEVLVLGDAEPIYGLLPSIFGDVGGVGLVVPSENLLFFLCHGRCGSMIDSTRLMVGNKCHYMS